MMVPLVLLSMSACGKSATLTSPTPAEPTGTIAVLGDSLAVSPTREANFPAVLQRRLATEGDPWRVLNFSRNGATTAEGVARLDEVLAEAPDILIVALGANDGVRGVPVETVRAQLDDIITRAMTRGIRVLLCGMEAPPLNGLRYSLAFRGVFPGLAREYDLPLVPFLLTGVVGRPDMNLEDWVHPNALGAERIADTVWVFLEPMVRRVHVHAGGR
jgi:acyl-CoA thioesterase I